MYICKLTCPNKNDIRDFKSKEYLDWTGWLSDYCLTPNEQRLSHIMARTSYILMR